MPKFTQRIKTYEDFKWIVFIYVMIFFIAVPSFLLSPYLFHDISYSNLLNTAKYSSYASVIIGLWLTVVAFHLKDKEKQLFEDMGLAQEGILLILPYILYIGTKSLIHSIMSIKQ